MRIMKAAVKTLLAGVVAVAILCGIFSFYSIIPVHLENEKGNTDYVWPANSLWVKMTEGFSFGRYDANGYNNPEVIENPDILVLGSSHMEANNVMQDENLTYCLNQELGGRFKAYNLGISGHHFTKVCKYLPVTMQLYEQTPEVIIIETSNTYFTEDDVDCLLQGAVDFTPSHSTGVLAALQRLPFARQAYHQLSGGLLELFMPDDDTQVERKKTEEKIVSEAAYDDLFGYISDTIASYDTEVIIFYHTTGKLQEDGSIVYQRDAGCAMFAEKCKEYGITFLDMTDSFLELYDEMDKVPYGFSTGALGEGHLNADGHDRIAQELADVIAGLEEEGKICK